MATTTYQCNVCKRVIQKKDNLSGLTIFGKCIITSGCLGQLNRLSRNIDNSREVFPSAVSGILDYTPRRAFFSYDQSLLSDTWTINHNLSTFPAINAYVSTIEGTALLPLDPEQFTISVIDKDTVNIKFKQPYIGTAQCIARSTTLRSPSTVKTSSLVQISTNGLITMAIPEIVINPPPIPNTTMDGLGLDVEVLVQEPSQQIVSSVEHIDPTVDGNSPWDDWSKILVRKRKNYLIRTKSILQFLAFGSNAKASDIPNGTQIYFNRIAFPNIVLRSINARELLFLMSNAPYAPIDKIKDKVVDVGEMLKTPLNYFVYMNGDLFVDSSLVETSYPTTLKVI
jgi:hypothetical protein